jgi:hypothetical protein
MRVVHSAELWRVQVILQRRRGSQTPAGSGPPRSSGVVKRKRACSCHFPRPYLILLIACIACDARSLHTRPCCQWLASLEPIMFYVSTLLALCVLVVFGPRAASSSLPDALACPRGYATGTTSTRAAVPTIQSSSFCHQEKSSSAFPGLQIHSFTTVSVVQTRTAAECNMRRLHTRLLLRGWIAQHVWRRCHFACCRCDF